MVIIRMNFLRMFYFPEHFLHINILSHRVEGGGGLNRITWSLVHGVYMSIIVVSHLQMKRDCFYSVFLYHTFVYDGHPCICRKIIGNDSVC